MTSVETKKKIEVPASAAVLFIIGCLVILCGVIAGFSIGVDRWGRVTAAAFIYWIGGVISGTLFISLGKIIELLTAIANKDYVIVNEIKTEENVDKQITVDSEKVVEKEIEEKKTIPEVVTGDLQEFFNKAVSMEKYLDVQKCWKDMKMDTIDTYAAYTEVIEKKAYRERMYGSSPDEVRKNVSAWSEGNINL